MSNIFYVPVRDEAGNLVLGASVGAYTNIACTDGYKASLVNGTGDPISNPFTVSDGDEYVYVADATVEMLYFKVVGQSVIVPIRCSNVPAFADYAAQTALPSDSDLVLLEIGGVRKKMTWDNLCKHIVAQIVAKTDAPATRTGFVVTDNQVNPTHASTLTVKAGAPGTNDGVRGDVWAQVS